MLCRHANNQDNEKYFYEQLLNKNARFAKQYIQNDQFMNNEVIYKWREAFKKFKTKKGARSSVENLLKRVRNDYRFKSINPIVDLYHAVSLKYALPIGAIDLDKLDNNLELCLAKGHESFNIFDKEGNNPPFEGEVIYKEGTKVVCRCFNWKESGHTACDDQTANAIIILEAIDLSDLLILKKAANELRRLIENRCKGQVSVHFLNKNAPELSLTKELKKA